MHPATNARPAPSETGTRTRASLRRDRPRAGARTRSRDRDSARTRATSVTPASAEPLARVGTIRFRSRAWPLGRTRARGQQAARDAIRPSWIEIDGATLTVAWGWPNAHKRSWQRGDVGFVCSSGTTSREGAPARLILVTDKSHGEAVTATIVCDGFSYEAYATLRRHLRNFEAIGDAERSDPFTRWGVPLRAGISR